MAEHSEERSVIYEPDETPPTAQTAGLGLQYALLSLSGMILIPLVIFRAADAPESLLIWAVFASMVVCGLITALHGFPLGRFGAGYVLITGSTGTAIAVSVDALEAGGIALLASLMLASSLFQFALSLKLSMFRRVLTPTVSGVVLMLIPVTIMPVVFGMLDELPEGLPLRASLIPALVTLLALGGVMIKGTPKLRPWAPVVGMAAGSLVSAIYGLYDVERVVEAGWVGIPADRPAFGLDFGPAFLQLLPAFMLVFLVCTVRTVSGTLGIQGVSWRQRRAVDFRSVQGAVAADALSNLLSGLAGTVPNGVRATTIALTEFSGVAARRVGIVFGIVLAAMAFFPKILALVLAVPGPVIAGYIVVIIAMIFTLGMKMVVSDGLDRRQALVAGISFWVGVGCQYGFIFPEVVPDLAGGLLNSGLTAGGLTAIVLSLVMELMAPRRTKLETRENVAALPEIREFVARFSASSGWDEAMASRLDAASEETLLSLLANEENAATSERRLLVTARREGGDAVFEFIASGGEDNIEDRLALLAEGAAEEVMERQVSLRLLRHHASEVRHRQYHDEDFITVRVSAPTARPAAPGD